MSVRGEICYRISKALMRPPEVSGTQKDQYSEWRVEEMVRSWSHFSNRSIDGKDVLDFGWAMGPYLFTWPRQRHPAQSLASTSTNARLPAHAPHSPHRVGKIGPAFPNFS
ncbi:hypothetical protein [Altererythrobacter sp. TH136]|uniref:hypothetical protein n=1 Tax=Altererythrobacter sp. TH136 TaxID=2067415 RepID=UPI001FEEF618|nr:hypothetical protein [Altererythrobacter sp. TH136]